MVQVDHFKSIGYICCIPGGIHFVSRLVTGSDSQNIPMWSIAWFLWVLIFCYDRMLRFVPFLRYIFDTSIEQEGFQEGLDAGLITREFVPSVSRSIFTTALSISDTFTHLRPRQIVCCASSELAGYHILLPSTIWDRLWYIRTVYLPFWWILTFFTGNRNEAHDGLVTVSSQRARIDCVECSTMLPPPICLSCGTIYSTLDHASVLHDPSLRTQLVRDWCPGDSQID
jgi:hypothetical protein